LFVIAHIIFTSGEKLPANLTARLHMKSGGFSFGGPVTFMAWLLAVGALALACGVQSDFSRERKSGAQIIREGSFELDTTADKALLFFTPEGERAWVEGFAPKPIYPAQKEVAFQTNAVFHLDDVQEQSIWTIVEANSKDHVAEYVYLVEGQQLSRVRVQIEPLVGSRCRVHVHYVHTALSEKGLQFLATVTEDTYAQKMRDWQRMVAAAIRR